MFLLHSAHKFRFNSLEKSDEGSDSLLDGGSRNTVLKSDIVAGSGGMNAPLLRNE